MSLTSPTAFITQLDTQFRATASWTAMAGTTWYPSAPAGTTAPFAVFEATHRRVPYAEGARGLAQFDFAIAVTAAIAVGLLEQLAEDIISDLSGQFTGLAFRDFAHEISSDLGNEDIAAGRTTRTTVITGTAGLNP